MRSGAISGLQHAWEARYADFHGSGKVRDINSLMTMLSPAMKDEWARRMVDRWVMNTEDGFLGPVAIDIRPRGEIENGVFAVSTISTWLVTEGMFRRGCDQAAVHCTLSHLRGMVRDFGFPIAPECWDPDYKPWGSMYYNWDGAMVPLIIGRLAGVTWSVPEQTFKVSDHLPESWDYVHTFTPIKQGQEVKWCEVEITRKKKWRNVSKNITVKGCPLENIVIEPWLEGRELIKSTSSISKNKTLQRGHAAYEFPNSDNAKVTVKLGDRKRSVPLLVRVTPFERLFIDDITINAQPMMDGCQVRYTVDGSEPTGRSTLYRKPLAFDNSITLKVRAFRKGDTPGPANC